MSGKMQTLTETPSEETACILWFLYFRSQQIAQKKVTGKIFPLPLLFG